MAVMAGMEANSIDTIITDPPYGLGFMGKEWDTFKPEYLNKKRTADRKRKPRTDGRKGAAWNNGADAGTYDYNRNAEFQQWFTLWAKEVLRIAKPGAMMLVFGGTRTFHRLTCAIEDAGWQIRDCMMWLYGSGFPKSHDISKAIDKAKGAEREVVGQIKRGDVQAAKSKGAGYLADPANRNNEKQFGYGTENITAPATDLAKQWNGYGTALKPAWEPIIVAMKPLDGTFAHNAEKWGGGGLWIDGGRIEGPSWNYPKGAGTGGYSTGKFMGEIGKGQKTNPYLEKPVESHPQGRWPANLILDEESSAMLDEQSGTLAGGTGETKTYGEYHNDKRFNASKQVNCLSYKGSGGASRFFYCAKASRSERNAGLEGMEAQITDDGREKKIDNAYLRGKTLRQNNHPTVKPLKLMEYLCKLTRTPEGGVVLDPFGGSGTTAVACRNTGRKYILIEKDPHYCEIARARVKEARAGQGALFK